MGVGGTRGWNKSMRTIRLDDFSLREDGVPVPWPEGAYAIRLDDFTFVDRNHQPLKEEEKADPKDKR
jgi:hypothetical protein